MSDDSDKLTTYIPVHAMQFTNCGEGDNSFDSAVMCEIVDRTEEEIEIAFSTANPKRRTYLRFKVRDLAVELDREYDDTND
jgi:hypothetical protein